MNSPLQNSSRRNLTLFTLSLRLMCKMIIYIYTPAAWTTGKWIQSLMFQCSQCHVTAYKILLCHILQKNDHKNFQLYYFLPAIHWKPSSRLQYSKRGKTKETSHSKWKCKRVQRKRHFASQRPFWWKVVNRPFLLRSYYFPSAAW